VFEFDKHDRRQGSGAKPRAPYQPFEGGRRRAFLLWGEHCTECAAPDCYTSCALYAARPDGRCRRFEYGVYRNRNFPSASGFGAEVVFRRWGKIEAQGNVALLPSRAVAAAERTAGLLAPTADRLGRLARRVSGDQRWSWLSFSLLERLNRRLARRSGRPDAFVAELYNPGDAPVTLLLSMAVDRTRLAQPLSPSELPRPFLRTLTVPPGYFREDIPVSAFEQIAGSSLPFGIALTPGAEDGTHLVFLTLDFVQYNKSTPASGKAAPVARPAAKCVVFDLDNTLWDGILLEGSVALRARVAETFKALDERGILLSAVSKNAPEDALAQLKRFGLDEYLLFPAIGWGPKSEGVRRVAERLDIGIDSLIFVDDNPFERAEVAEAVPQVEVLPDTALATLLDHPRLQGAVTDESRRRRSMYKEAGARAEAAAAYGDDYRAFLRACEIEVEIRPPLAEDRQRVAELVQRTNQLNFSGRKYGTEEVDALLADAAREKYVVRCRDRYGDYGIVGFCLAAPDGGGVRVEDLMLSCRVQGKFIEQALFAHLVRRPGWSARFVEVNFVPTARNGAARAVLEALGFKESEGGRLRREYGAADELPDIIHVEGRWDEALSPAA
jgi:FkbH-like protein